MKITYCDVCGSVIKLGDCKYIIGQVELVEGVSSQKVSFKDVIEALEYISHVQELGNKEICSNCKRILDYFFNLRRAETENILEEINTIWEKESEK